MPEEHNRIVADHISDYLFVPTEDARQNLMDEDLREELVYVTGNTIVDAVYQNRELAQENSDILEKHGLEKDEFILVTLHRAENVDDRETLEEILGGLKKVSEEFEIPMIYPIHPRTEERLEEFELEGYIDSIARTQLVEPLPFLDFLRLEDDAHLVLTDSGGVQEEACILQTPCVTIRDNTERPETVEVGANKVSTIDRGKILEAAREMAGKQRNWENPFGEGNAAENIIDALEAGR